MLDILCGFFLFCSYLMQQLEHIESIFYYYFWDLLLPFYCLTILENVYMIHLYLNLFYEDYNAISQKQIHFSSIFLLILLDIFAKEIQKVLQ